MARLDLAHVFAVPGTGKRAPYRFLRHPRHIGVERFMAEFGLRGVKVPPDAWEDINRCVQRSWKVHRDTQWRAVE